MSEATTKIEGTIEAWEDGRLGESAEHAVIASPEVHAGIAQAIGMQAISIRLPKALIEDLKNIAAYRGVGYQPLARDALQRFAECEKRFIVAQLMEEKRKAQEALCLEEEPEVLGDEEPQLKPEDRKAA